MAMALAMASGSALIMTSTESLLSNCCRKRRNLSVAESGIEAKFPCVRDGSSYVGRAHISIQLLPVAALQRSVRLKYSGLAPFSASPTR